jgi:hypothetical protein
MTSLLLDWKIVMYVKQKKTLLCVIKGMIRKYGEDTWQIEGLMLEKQGTGMLTYLLWSQHTSFCMHCHKNSSDMNLVVKYAEGDVILCVLMSFET